MAIGVAPHVTHQSIQCIHSMLMCASCSSFVACGSWPLHLFSASSFWACVLKGRPPPMATSYVVWVLSLNAKSWIVVVSILVSYFWAPWAELSCFYFFNDVLRHVWGGFQMWNTVPCTIVCTGLIFVEKVWPPMAHFYQCNFLDLWQMRVFTGESEANGSVLSVRLLKLPRNSLFEIIWFRFAISIEALSQIKLSLVTVDTFLVLSLRGSRLGCMRLHIYR